MTPEEVEAMAEASRRDGLHNAALWEIALQLALLNKAFFGRKIHQHVESILSTEAAKPPEAK